MEYFISINLFSKYQYGFIKGRSAELQLLKVLDDWIKFIDNGDQLILYILTLKKPSTRYRTGDF